MEIPLRLHSIVSFLNLKYECSISEKFDLKNLKKMEISNFWWGIITVLSGDAKLDFD